MSHASTVNDQKYKAEYKAGTFHMTEAEYISLRRVDDGLEQLLPTMPATPEATSLALNPLAAGL